MDIRSKDNSDEDHRSRRKKTVEDKRKKKRRYSSTDSYSSDESSSDSYSSDSDSESDSSDTSSSSDHRHKRRKRTSRKDKYRHSRKKEPKRQRGQKKKSMSKSKPGPEPPSSSESESTSSSSSEAKKSNRRGERRKDTQLFQPAGPSTRTVIMHKDKEPERPKKNKQITDKDGPSDEEGEVLPSKDVMKDGHYMEVKSDKMIRKSSSPIENSKDASPVSRKPTSPTEKRTNHSKSPARGPDYDVSEPTLRQGQDASGNDSLNGAPKRIRKGRGFTEKYHFVRKYRSPSPERTSVQSNYYRGRNEYRRDWNRYPNPRQQNFNEHGNRQRRYNEHSPPRVYRGSPRGSSPHRYRSRRARSRSISRSPVRYHGQRDNSRSPRTRRSSLHDRRPAGDHLQSSRDIHGRVHQTGRGRSKSRSRSRGSASKSPDHAGEVNNVSKRNRKSRSSSRSSSPGNNGLVSYGDGSPDA